MPTHLDTECVETSIVEDKWVLPVESNIGSDKSGREGAILMGLHIHQTEVASIISFQGEGDRPGLPKITIPCTHHQNRGALQWKW